MTEKLNREVEVESEFAKSNNSSKHRAYRPRSWLDPSWEKEITSTKQHIGLKIVNLTFKASHEG